MKGKETRQEFKPIMEELIDNAYAEPLHNTNNSSQKYNHLLHKEAIHRSLFSCNAKLGELPEGNVSKTFIYLPMQLRLSSRLIVCLKNKKMVLKW